MIGKLACELCGREGETPSEEASCGCGGGGGVVSTPDDILSFNMGVYSLRICRGCRERSSDEELTEKIRDKVRRRMKAS